MSGLRLIPMTLLWLACSVLTAQEASPRIRRDVVYGHKDGLALTFDVLTPERPNGAAVLHLMSGGWYSSWRDPEQMVAAERPFLQEGYTVFLVRHGSAPKYTVPEAVADVRRCVRVVRMRASEFGVDPERLGVLGASAGGHLTLMLATTGDDGNPESKDLAERASSRISAGVALFPPTDLRGWTTNPPAEIAAVPALKPPLTFDAALEASVSPLLAVTPDDAPVLMIHGDQDKLVPVEHSRNILPKFEEQGIPSKLLVIEGAGHGYSPAQNEQQVIPAMQGWFREHLQKRAAGPN